MLIFNAFGATWRLDRLGKCGDTLPQANLIGLAAKSQTENEGIVHSMITFEQPQQNTHHLKAFNKIIIQLMIYYLIIHGFVDEKIKNLHNFELFFSSTCAELAKQPFHFILVMLWTN